MLILVANHPSLECCWYIVAHIQRPKTQYWYSSLWSLAKDKSSSSKGWIISNAKKGVTTVAFCYDTFGGKNSTYALYHSGFNSFLTKMDICCFSKGVFIYTNTNTNTTRKLRSVHCSLITMWTAFSTPFTFLKVNSVYFFHDFLDLVLNSVHMNGVYAMPGHNPASKWTGEPSPILGNFTYLISAKRRLPTPTCKSAVIWHLSITAVRYEFSPLNKLC